MITIHVVDPALQHLQLPFRFVFGDDAESARPFLQGLLAHQTVESRFEYAPGESVESEWEACGFSLSGGYDIPPGDQYYSSNAMGAVR